MFGLSMLCKTEGGGSDGKEDTVSVAERSLGNTSQVTTGQSPVNRRAVVLGENPISSSQDAANKEGWHFCRG